MLVNRDNRNQTRNIIQYRAINYDSESFIEKWKMKTQMEEGR